MMKINSIKLKNFANFKEFTCNLGGGVNYISGSNGAGKSTVGITSVWACLKGIAERGDVLKGKRFMWIGKDGNDAEITIVLRDKEGVEYRVNRKIAENRLEITASSGKKLDQNWINSFWSELMLSPIAFSRLTPKEQATYMGIDTSEYDEKIELLKEEAAFLRRSVKEFGEIEIPEKVDQVDIAVLSTEKDEIVRFNQEQQQAQRDVESAIADVASKKMVIKSLEEQLELAKRNLKNSEERLSSIPQPQALLPTTEVDSKISEASATNTRALAYQEAVKRQRQKDDKQMQLEQNLQSQKEVLAKKVEYMQDLDLPFSNLSIDDNGGLLMDGRPIANPHFSTGELIKVTTILLSSRNPDWRYVYLENFDLLDADKSKDVLDWLLEKDFQVLAEKVVSNQGDVLILQDAQPIS